MRKSISFLFSSLFLCIFLCILALRGADTRTFREVFVQNKPEDSASPAVQTNEEPLSFSRPLDAGEITSLFGTRSETKHTGIDIGVHEGTPIYAACDGCVLKAEEIPGYGNTVILEHENGFSTLYAHCSSLLCSAGDNVSQGTVIALSGSTGKSTGPHLHFEVRKDEKALNPQNYISF